MTAESTTKQRLVALQHRDFRLMWGGQLVSAIGSEMQLVAVDWHVFELLRGQIYTINLFGQPFALHADALGLGGLGLVRIIPIILFALLGGLVADARDRRRVMLVTQGAAVVFAGALAAFTLSGRESIPVVYALTAALAATAAFDSPARHSIVPSLVPREHLTNAVSLNTLNWQIGRIVGPMIAGVMLRFVGTGFVYAANAATFLAVVIALLLMRYRGRGHAETMGVGFGPLLEGLRFTFRSRIILSTMLLDFFATFFSSARTMLPIVAETILDSGVVGYSVLRTAQPIGALLAGAIVALRKDIHQQGKVLLWSVAVYGLATALFGVSTLMALSYVLFAITGAADTVSTVIRGTIRQLVTPDHLRGRMVSVNMVFFMGGPQLGELEAGLVSAAIGVPFAIVSGGIATVLLTLWIARQYPRLRRYTSEMLAADTQAA